MNFTRLFSDTLIEEAQSHAEGMVRASIEDQLARLGIVDAEPLVDALLKHVRSDSEEPFEWDGEIGTEETINIDLNDTSDQLEAFLESIESGEICAEIMQSAIKESAEVLFKELHRDWPEQRIHEDAGFFGFRERLLVDWEKPFRLHRMLLTCSREIFDDFAQSSARSRAKRGIDLREALFYVYGRVLRTATAVHTLLAHGMADEAYARCRTIYELYVVGSFIADQGDAAAKRYLEHDAVAQGRRLIREVEWGTKKIPKRLQRSIERDYANVIRKYGKSFKHDYGWASPFLFNKRGVQIEKPSLDDIANATLQGLPSRGHAPFYLESCFQVHGGVAGAIGLGGGGDSVFTAGSSNLGLDVPFANAAYYLSQASIVVANHSISRDYAKKSMLTLVLVRLDEEVDKSAKACARRLEKKTRQLRRSGE